MDINKLIYSECQNPVKIRIYDVIKKCYVTREVPCGKCYHCKITRINEWVTRMVIEADYSNYVYYGTLTYDGRYNNPILSETLPYYSADNKLNKLSNTPLILRKDHLQKFFKRLRKNTGVKFQYAACGEYGEKYGRPHFHYIIFTNQCIKEKDIKKAWSYEHPTIKNKRRTIGRIEHRDIKNQPYIIGNQDNSDIYKYVCKYIQKYDFDFEKLLNINKHKQVHYEEFIKSSVKVRDKVINISKKLDDYLKEKNPQTWRDYTKVFSPFFLCSKKPAIGLQYLQDNISRFQEADFRLFGYEKNYIFPLYFVRKTKEYLCPLKMQSKTNGGKTSYSNIPNLAALLADIENAKQIGESTEQIINLFRYRDNYYEFCTNKRYNNYEQINIQHKDIQDTYTRFNVLEMSFYDVNNGFYYSYRGNYYAVYYYDKHTREQEYSHNVSIDEVLNLINYYYYEVHDKLLIPLARKSALSADKKESLIQECGGIEEFEKQKKLCLKNLNNNISRRQHNYKLTKTEF